MPFDATSQCLGAYQPLGLVDADDLPVTCDPVCLMLDETLYVSVVCAPYPDRAQVVKPADSADCAAALALLDSDGGSCDAAGL